ncbi:dihydroxyacetone kinase subunit L [Vibrio sp. SS-MA-C1-2]|uniref:dihydroxyacetone kinase subunit DhaL n=1 Tax=Vibrio sp. SS-MA-C1-2 TaxID=2908646 RepID=UPI001F1C5745|nr:dihydroxyacetone kinase subunit DhaL [Vibrio sp. SS-MA-C1-2]UJF18486.1 dihydroxyacetone kinase subunit L [Vibrio sp. SS-MA-C1-2]
MDTLTTKKMMLLVANKMVSSEPHLTKLDQAIGDGDHGIGMERGFSAVSELLSSDYQPENVSKLMIKIGSTMMATMGGASGAIFGTLFRAGGKAIKGKNELDIPTFSLFLDAGLEAIYQRGGAKPGDKTMIDALVVAMNKSKQLTGNFEDNIQELATIAMNGAESTKQMIATTGKAKTLGERSLGHPDPGAVSMALILEFMAEFATESIPA